MARKKSGIPAEEAQREALDLLKKMEGPLTTRQRRQVPQRFEALVEQIARETGYSVSGVRASLYDGNLIQREEETTDEGNEE